MRLLRFVFGKLLCAIGSHDRTSYAQELGFAAPPPGHPCRPLPTDSAAEIVERFDEWTRLRCRRCRNTYP